MTTEIRFFALKNKKEKVLDRGQNGFKCEDNNNNRPRPGLADAFIAEYGFANPTRGQKK